MRAPEPCSKRRSKEETRDSIWLVEPQKLGAGAERSVTFRGDRAFLEKLFPRGRLRISEDGHPILIPRSKDLYGWHLFRHGDGVGIYWCGNWPLLKRATEGLMQHRHSVNCGEEEGFLFLAADPRLEERLPMFSKRKSKGNLAALRQWQQERAKRADSSQQEHKQEGS